MKNNDVFVKLNLKNIGEVRSLIVDKGGSEECNNGRYMICAGKYDKTGWTIVFKAKNYKEAEYIIENTPFNKRTYSPEIMIKEKIVC
ncbi:hypothetical protein [Clostridium vincentii]|uniref:YCII-related domain-containing protein n=1 Tax=Clostridium vincentii TaxID=52704 RepID=A0A2T0BH80_9CLOT|nr:hypothetical protein [Clostridium vincentii]PRR83256.1 hypothetical protein CLVI_10550 [Clostridium vincentii]